MSRDGEVLAGALPPIGPHDFQGQSDQRCDLCSLVRGNPIHHGPAILQAVKSFERGRTLCRERIQWRLKQHRDNLAGWSEGERCDCEIGKYTAPARPDAEIKCFWCGNTGIKHGTKGYLLPTEPDPEEREMVRMRLRVAIDECEAILKEIG